MEVQKLQVLNDNILVEGIIVEKRGGVVVGVTQDDKPQEGKVLSVGTGRVLENGEIVPVKIKVGMHILFNEHTTTKFIIDKKTYFVLREEDVVGYQK
jgi:chaperonin GroES